MTARRQNSATAAAAAFGRALPPRTPKPAGQTTDDQKAAAVPATAAKPSKYTLLLTQEEVLVWDRLLMQLRADLGRRVDKSELVRVLVAFTADDPTLRSQVADELRARAQG